MHGFDVLRHIPLWVGYSDESRDIASHFETVDVSTSFKSAEWQHFVFPVFTNENGEKNTVKTKTAYKIFHEADDLHK